VSSSTKQAEDERWNASPYRVIMSVVRITERMAEQEQNVTPPVTLVIYSPCFELLVKCLKSRRRMDAVLQTTFGSSNGASNCSGETST
jgi:hypothetical protein